MLKKIIIIGVSLFILITGFIFYKEIDKENIDISNTLQIDDSINLDTGYEKVNWDSLEKNVLDLSNKSLNIDKEGTYILQGTINNGNIMINVSGNVKLILDNVSITNNLGPAIIVEQAENTIIELKKDSVNTLIDGSNYENLEYDGCVFSKDDLILKGEGTLNVTSNYLDAIVSNDDLTIESGNYIINSNDDGIRGKDSVYIIGGDFIINSNGDGIKSTNDTDTEKGYINILDGNFNINAFQDGIQAETKLIIENGNFNIKTSFGNESEDSALYKKIYGGSSYDSTSRKALKSRDNLVIKNGIFTIDSKDDAIHSNNYLGITNGVINIKSGDDGIHADTEIIIDDGNINIAKSYEGIEASDITVNGGSISIIASDDGINVSGGKDSSSMGGRPGQNHFSSSSGTLTINEGKIYVDATGDGLDANGNIVINGGEISVDGPTNSGNGALDYDASFNINGGTFIAVGSSGMAQGPSNSSNQYAIMFYLNNSYDGKKIILKDKNGNEIISYIPKKKYESVVISSDKIKNGETYNLIIDGSEVETLTTDSIVTSNGFGGMMGGNVPGHHPGRR